MAGTLPSVSFIDPNFIDEPDGLDNDDGAPAEIAAGQHLIATVVNAVIQGPKWNKTLLIITYDEHGGFYDHVSPLLFRDKQSQCPASTTMECVPAFVISPWVIRGGVTDVVFDHTSIAKTIARRFMSANPPDMGNAWPRRTAFRWCFDQPRFKTNRTFRRGRQSRPAPSKQLRWKKATISSRCCESCAPVIRFVSRGHWPISPGKMHMVATANFLDHCICSSVTFSPIPTGTIS